MNSETTATVIVNHTAEGLSVIGIDFYVETRKLHIFSSKRFIDELNSIPLLSEDGIRSAIVKKYGILNQKIQFQ